MASRERHSEIKILQQNIRDLQQQLANAQRRIMELTTEKNSKVDQEKQLLNELEKELKKKDSEAAVKIQKQIDDWPDVLDSKPPESFKRPPQPKWSVREGEKWVKIDPDGTMKFEDIEIKK